jgi:hypothetical protein
MKSVIFTEIVLNLFFAALLTTIGVTVGLYPAIKGHFQPVWHFIGANPWVVPLTGFMLAICGVALFRTVYSHLQKCHFEMVTGKIKTWVDENTLEKILQEFWKEKFADDELTCYAHIHKNKLHIAAELPENQSSEAQLSELRTDLSDRLHKSLGYIDEFSLALIEKDALKKSEDSEEEI